MGAVYYSGPMSGRNGQELLSTWVPADVAAAFKAHARGTDGGTSAALRRLVYEATTGLAPAAPRGAGTGTQVGVRLKPEERTALAEAARSRGTSPANWLRSLAIVHLMRQPQWNTAEIEELRLLFREVRAIGNNVNQIAHALNIAVQTGKYPPYQGAAAREAAELLRLEMRRIVAVMTGNFEYWGMPDK
ncbi:plasmid mobilization relaxosome protein MobC [Salmonella enterica]|uniref:MobC family plasmid mobilization relaxosome protein n=1 Tax=Pseudomonadota TaxID=1224 RepID=UPI0009B3CF30|nr:MULTISPECIES: MobC family plasmid mobilization relaxosome protein [Pseudomonadota]EAB1567115.1 plasmid mobilization relaxosome protein MobC [Salmonella enterica]ECE0326006.1 plasmid mobilization relaxosome protein MobC [Salmonella enterica subsp. enterica]ELK6626050.1 plasmid mobilization relaxosome protein MobC [Citrobacter amalonaticus]HCJ7377293.1 plasmid mobilization relaxosome protein MobC [Enterobacter hormaechei subsp. xiangfangensis]EAB1716139.1 plasmid mobilization relaxosome prote